MVLRLPVGSRPRHGRSLCMERLGDLPSIIPLLMVCLEEWRFTKDILPMLFWLALTAQSVAVSPPPAPAWGRAEEVANGFRRTCLSEKGVAIALKGWAEGQAAAKAQQSEHVRIERELSEAAYASPIDLDRLERAAQARNTDQARYIAENTRSEIATLRRLSPEDRLIYARNLATYRPEAIVRTCSVNQR